MIWFLAHPYLTSLLTIVLLSVINTTIQGIINIFGSHKEKIPDEPLIKDEKPTYADSFVDPNVH
jgi:hypothetical protein